MGKINLLVWCSLLSLTAPAQTDTTFWFVAPEAAASHGDQPVFMRFATLDQPAQVTVEQPANPNFPVQVLSLGPNDAVSINLAPWLGMVENYPPDQVLNYGFRIHSTARIMAYYEISPSCNCNPDIFALKGRNGLGQHFLVPFQHFLDNASYGRPAINLVATEDNTTVTITPTQNVVGHPANVPYTIVLNRGQTYCAEGVSTAASQHPGGTVIVSDKDIAVTMSDDSLMGGPYGPCADIIGDQLVPVAIVGTEYIALKGYLNGPDRVFVLATQPNTTVFADGAQVALLQPTQTYMYSLSNPSVFLTASAPVYVLQMAGFGCEVGGSILPPIECTGSNSVAFVRSTGEFIALNILVPAGGENDFLLNGNPAALPGSAFQFVPGTGNQWMYALVDVGAFTTPGQASRIENSSQRFHVGMIHGGAVSGCRFGYFSDFAAFKYDIQLADATICEGDQLDLNVLPIPGALYQWSGPAGFSDSGTPQTTVANISESNEGEYVVSGYEGLCPILEDTVFVAVHQPVAHAFSTDICAGESYAFDGAELTGAGEYTGIFSSALGCDSVVTLQLNVREVYELAFSPTICQGESFEWNGNSYTSPGSYPVLFSSAFGCDSLVTLHLEVVEAFETSQALAICEGEVLAWNDMDLSEPGEYLAELQSADGCDSLVTLQLQVHPVYSFSLDASICDGEAFELNGESYSASGTYQQVFTTQAGCDSLVTLHLQVNPIASSTLPVTLCGDEVFTLGGETFDTPGTYPVTLTASTGCDSLVTLEIIERPEYLTERFDTLCAGQQAQVGDQVFTGAGTYDVLLQSAFGCDSLVTLHLHYLPEAYFDLHFPNVFTPNGDGKNDTFGLEGTIEFAADFTLAVYSRWGAEVYSADSADERWDGKVGPDRASAGVYYYIARFSDTCSGTQRELTGYVTLLE